MRLGTEPGPTIVVWGHYHGGNVGDDIVVATIVHAIRRRVLEARIIGISLAPADTRARHGIEAYPINPRLPEMTSRETSSELLAQAPKGLSRIVRRVPLVRWLALRALNAMSIVREGPFLWRSYRLLRGVDLIVVAGSGQLDEWQGTWYHPWTLFRWATLARLARVPMVYASVGAGPINGKLSSFFIRRAVAGAERISVRDEHSSRVLRSIRLTRPFPVCPDMAYGLPAALSAEPRTTSDRDGRGMLVGISVMAYQDPRYWPRGNVEVYEAYLRKTAVFARRLVDRGHTVRVYSQTLADDRVAEDFVGLLAESEPLAGLSSKRLKIERVIRLDDLARAITSCDVVVGARYHFILASLLCDVPVLALSYHPKTSDLLATVGRPERCLDINAFDDASLDTAFEALCVPDEPAAHAALRARVAEHRAAVEEQFDTIFGLPLVGSSADGRPASPEPVAHLRPSPTSASHAVLETRPEH